VTAVNPGAQRQALDGGSGVAKQSIISVCASSGVAAYRYRYRTVLIPRAKCAYSSMDGWRVELTTVNTCLVVNYAERDGFGVYAVNPVTK
jgi:hypothetical protein